VDDEGVEEIICKCHNMIEMDLSGLDQLDGLLFPLIPLSMPHLRRLKLEMCGAVDDENLNWIVIEMKGQLEVIDFYHQYIVYDANNTGNLITGFETSQELLSSLSNSENVTVSSVCSELTTLSAEAALGASLTSEDTPTASASPSSAEVEGETSHNQSADESESEEAEPSDEEEENAGGDSDPNGSSTSSNNWETDEQSLSSDDGDQVEEESPTKQTSDEPLTTAEATVIPEPESGSDVANPAARFRRRSWADERAASVSIVRDTPRGSLKTCSGHGHTDV